MVWITKENVMSIDHDKLASNGCADQAADLQGTGGFLELADRRRSVRRYAARPIEADKIRRCLEAARLAPSACNSQPWMFIVIDNPELKDQVAAATGGGVLPLNHFTRQAPVLVAVLAEQPNLSSRAGAIVKTKPFPLMDAAIATEHFCLQAAEEGLGTCILGWFDEDRVRSLLNVPATSRPLLILTLGYSDPDASVPGRQRKSIEAISARNVYPGVQGNNPPSVTGRRSLAGLACWLGITYVAAAVGGAATTQAGDFYVGLTRPAWAPPGWLFGPVWMLLYTLMGVAAWLVWRRAGIRGARIALGLFLLQLAVNALWSWLFFAWRLGAASFAWILLLIALVLGTGRAFKRINSTAGNLLVPYLVWLVFAAALACAVWRLNPGLL